MLRASALLLILTAACTTEPETSPGTLTHVRDQAYACDDTANDSSWACSLDLTLDGATLTSVGIHNDGSENGPRAVGTLSAVALADLDALIATVPTEIDNVEGVGCGEAPVATRSYTINFDSVGLRELDYHSAEGGPLLELKNRVTGLITAIDTCQGNDSISFESCSPRIQQNQ